MDFTRICGSLREENCDFRSSVDSWFAECERLRARVYKLEAFIIKLAAGE